VRGLWTIEIEEAQTARFPPKSLNSTIEHADRVPLDGKNSPGNAACLAPNLDPKPARPQLERVLAGYKPRHFFAILDRCGVPAFTQKRFDCHKQSAWFNGLRRLGCPFIMEFCH